MRDLKILAISLLLFSACVDNSCHKDGFVVVPIENGIMDLSNIDSIVNKVVFRSNRNFKQQVCLDSLGKIQEVQNVIEKESNEDIINTWIAFDKQGNINFPLSYYYDTYLSADSASVYVNCSLERLILDNGKYYILKGDYDDLFKLGNGAKQDTIFFNDDFRASLRIDEWEKGSNNIKFIIVEEKFENGKLKYKNTYVNKDFYLK